MGAYPLSSIFSNFSKKHENVENTHREGRTMGKISKNPEKNSEKSFSGPLGSARIAWKCMFLVLTMQGVDAIICYSGISLIRDNQIKSNQNH
jgi:hypothetical protein